MASRLLPLLSRQEAILFHLLCLSRRCALGHRQVPNRHGSLLTHLLSFSPCPSPASSCRTTLSPTANHTVNVCIHEFDARSRRPLSLARSSIWNALFRLVSDPLFSQIRRCSTVVLAHCHLLASLYLHGRFSRRRRSSSLTWTGTNAQLSVSTRGVICVLDRRRPAEASGKCSFSAESRWTRWKVRGQVLVFSGMSCCFPLPRTGWGAPSG